MFVWADIKVIEPLMATKDLDVHCNLIYLLVYMSLVISLRKKNGEAAASKYLQSKVLYTLCSMGPEESACQCKAPHPYSSRHCESMLSLLSPLWVVGISQGDDLRWCWSGKHRPATQRVCFLFSVSSEAMGSSLAKDKTGVLHVICAVSLLLTGLL